MVAAHLSHTKVVTVTGGPSFHITTILHPIKSAAVMETTTAFGSLHRSGNESPELQLRTTQRVHTIMRQAGFAPTQMAIATDHECAFARSHRRLKPPGSTLSYSRKRLKIKWAGRQFGSLRPARDRKIVDKTLSRVFYCIV